VSKTLFRRSIGLVATGAIGLALAACNSNASGGKPAGSTNGSNQLKTGTVRNREVVQGGSYNHLAADDVLVNNTGGGGGYGNRFDREPERVAHDVRNDFVSVEAAARDYGVALRSDTFEVDTETTERLRRDANAIVSA
jgi:N-methylhydantoinase B